MCFNSSSALRDFGPLSPEILQASASEKIAKTGLERWPHYLPSLFTLILTPGDIFFMDSRKRKGEEERKREKHSLVGCLSFVPQWNPQSRYVLWPGFEPVTLWLIGGCSNHSNTGHSSFSPQFRVGKPFFFFLARAI